jgi:hypothetical protein
MCSKQEALSLGSGVAKKIVCTWKCSCYMFRLNIFAGMLVIANNWKTMYLQIYIYLQISQECYVYLTHWLYMNYNKLHKCKAHEK